MAATCMMGCRNKFGMTFYFMYVLVHWFILYCKLLTANCYCHCYCYYSSPPVQLFVFTSKVMLVLAVRSTPL